LNAVPSCKGSPAIKERKSCSYRNYPFTIILKHRIGGELQPVEIKFDPGSRTTGIALVGHFKRGSEVLWAGNLNHKGFLISSRLESRRSVRRSRRNRKTRYRPARFDNRRRKEGWLPPSLRSRVLNVKNWRALLLWFLPITLRAVETVRFYTQKLQNAEIKGIEYQ